MRGSPDRQMVISEREHISILSFVDRLLLAIFAVSFCLAMVGLQILGAYGVSIFVSAIVASSPLAIVGISYCLAYRKNYILALIALAVIGMLFLTVDMSWILASVSIGVGLIGVLALVSVFQKAIFYPVLASIEYLNIKSRLSFSERVVSFLFSISGDLDTRNIEIDTNLNRASIPWREVASTMRLSFMAGLFIWIYISMNPSWMSSGWISDVPVYLFSLMLYIPLMVMPFSIFMSLNVRISTKYKDFKVYDGVKMTLYKMVVPIVAAFFYVLIAVNNSGIWDVFYFILLSAFFNLIINTLACLMFYRWFEGTVINEIRSKWSVFRPISMTMVIEDEDPVVKEDVPDTPRRDMSDLGVMVFGDSHE